MKRISYPLNFLLLISLFSCSDKQSDTAVNEITCKSFSGKWISLDYMECLKTQKSSFTCYKFLTSISELNIQDTDSNSIPVKVSLNNHELTEGFLYSEKVDSGNRFRIRYEMDTVEVSLRVNNQDTQLVLSKVGSEKAYRTFSKVNNSCSEEVPAIDCISMNILIAGKYDLFVKDKKSGTVTLDNEGKIYNWKEFSEYHIITDFTETPYDGNLIILRKSTNNGDNVLMSWNKTPKGIVFNELTDLPDGFRMQEGTVKFTLIRKQQ
jgi:hypothetical protein